MTFIKKDPLGRTLPAGWLAGVAAALLQALILALGTGQALAEEPVSGRLVNGFRVLSATELAGHPDILVYRGDYIKFEFPGETGAVFAVPALDIEEEVPAQADQAPYFKMKQEGVFDYLLGETRGTIRVKEYGGVHYQALTAQEARKIMESISPLILDVRTPMEYQAGRIQGGQLLPVQLLQQNLSVLEPYKEDPVLIYCATGNRSTVAAKILIDNGFKRIYNLRNGIKDWQEKGLPVVK